MRHLLDFVAPYSSKNAIFCGLKLTLRRNLKGYLFPSKITLADRQKLFGFLNSSLKQSFPSAHFQSAPFPHEVHEYFPKLWHETSALMIDKDKKLIIHLFGHDHLAIDLYSDSLDTKTLYDALASVENQLNNLDFAFLPKLGYLTSHPEFSGHGLSLEAYVFCPSSESFETLDDRMSIEPYFACDSFFCIKTKNTTNLDRLTLLNLFTKQIQSVVQNETLSQDSAYKLKKEALIDEVSKALAVLKGAYQLKFEEAFTHLLSLKQGYHLGLLEGLDQDFFLSLMQQAQKSFLSEKFHQKDSSDAWLHERASWLNEALRDVFLKKS